MAKDSDVEKIEACKQAVKMNPDYADAHANLGDAYQASFMYEEAIESYKQAIRIDPNFTAAYFNLGLAHIFLNDRGSALVHYKILQSLDSELANKLYHYMYE